MKQQRIYTLLVALALAFSAFGQWAKPVSFNIEQKRISPTEIAIIFHGSINGGWHVYSTNISEDGPTRATFNIDKASGIKLKGALKAHGQAVQKMDPVFNMEVSYFENKCTFEQRLEITDTNYSLEGYLQYGACNDHNCLPPTAVECSIKGSDGPDVAQKAPLDKETLLPSDSAANSNVTVATTASDSLITTGGKELWTSKVEALKSLGQEKSGSNNHTGLWWLFLMGVVGGLIAVVTPCVWPIIPMTVSFFLKRAEKRRRGIRDALIYGLSIVMIYVGLGLLITLIFGASALNALSTNAIVNIFFFLLLVAFGVSFLGVFELQLPSSWSNKADQKAEQTSGIVSIFIMAFTLALVSFSCTGPIIGFLLVEVATMGNIIGPLIGMLGFAIALALPFTLFALFPSLLKKQRMSGSWMNTVKVMLGIIELAFSLKFLSVADLAYGWHLLDREIFIILWIALAVFAGLYLMGVIKLPIDGGTKPRRHIVKTTLAIICFLFATYMVPGLLGRPLKAISAFTPPMYTQHIRLWENTVEADFRDYEQGMAYARQTGKNVVLDFTGFGCVNCREMEQKVWNDPDVAKKLRNDYVLISLYVDDKSPLPERVRVMENGMRTTLRTIGDKWSYLQRVRFGANAQPFYVITSPSGDPLMPAYGFDTDAAHFLRFLNLEHKK